MPDDIAPLDITHTATVVPPPPPVEESHLSAATRDVTAKKIEDEYNRLPLSSHTSENVLLGAVEEANGGKLPLVAEKASDGRSTAVEVPVPQESLDQELAAFQAVANNYMQQTGQTALPPGMQNLTDRSSILAATAAIQQATPQTAQVVSNPEQSISSAADLAKQAREAVMAMNIAGIIAVPSGGGYNGELPTTLAGTSISLRDIPTKAPEPGAAQIKL